MPSELKLIQSNTFTGGMNSDLAEEHMPTDVYRYMLNCDVLSTSEGNVGIVVNPKGNTMVPVRLPVGTNKTIGAVSDEETNNMYFAVWNSEGMHTWYRYNSTSRSVVSVIQNITDTGETSIWNWNSDDFIIHANIIDNNLLYWVKKDDPAARKINISKALDKSDAGYGGTIEEEFTRAYKKTAYYPPGVIYFTDGSKKFNRLYGRLFKFSQRFIYDDGEKSNWSDWSLIPLPDEEYFTGTRGVPLTNNGINITIEAGSSIVSKIEIAMQQTNPEGGVKPWVSIAVLDKKELSIANNGSYTFSFFNDVATTPVDELKIHRHYSYLPKNPICQDFTKNALLYANFKEGFPSVDVDISSDVIYKPLFIDDGVSDDYNSPSLSWIQDGDDYVRPNFLKAGYRENWGRIIVGPDVIKGNTFTFRLDDARGLILTYTVTAGLTDTNENIANNLAAAMKVNNTGGRNGLRFQYIRDVKKDSAGNAYFEIRASNNRGRDKFFSGYASFTASRKNSLKDNGQSVPNIKLGSSASYGMMYEDEDGRKSAVYTEQRMVVPIKTINELGDIKAPLIQFTINHKPPIWAKNYQIVRTRDLVYLKYIQILIQESIKIETSSGDIYSDLVIGSLFTYQQLHPNTTLKYEFKKGDRVKIVRSYSNNNWTIPAKTKDFEIIEYKDVVIEDKNEDVKVDGTNTVIVESGSIDNIGSYIVINDNERLITAATLTEYTLDKSIGSGESGSQDWTYSSYQIINRRGVIRIKFDPEYEIVADSAEDKFALVEIYTPSIGDASVDDNQFFEFGQKFPINNWGTEEAYHAGNNQSQTSVDPAIIEISNGVSYVRNRELPVTNNPRSPQVLVSSIEDYSYSDFYVSDMNNNGRVNALDTGDGEVHFGSRIRFSNNYIEGTKINGLNDFDNLDREDYNDKYGDIQRILFDEGKLYVFKFLKDAWMPVYGNIISDQDGNNLMAQSDKLLPKSLQYFLWDGGVGDNPESISRNGNNIFHVSPNSGILARIGGNGVEPISKTYHLDKDTRDYIRSANTSKAKMIGSFNRKTGSYILGIEAHDKVIYNSEFSESGWELEDNPVVEVGPSVDAGADQSVVGSILTLSGTVTAGTNPISFIIWEQVSGPNQSIISNPSSEQTLVTGLIEGDYIFKLTAVDSIGRTNSDTVMGKVTEIGLKAFYGNKGNGSIPSLSEIENSGFTAFPPGSDIEIPFELSSSPMYSWVAYPTTETLKSEWQDKGVAINNGSIGGLSDTFGPYVVVGDYRVTITQFATEFDNPIIFKV